MTSTALRLLQQLVKKSESKQSLEGEDRSPARRCWNVDARIHCARIVAARNIRQAHMNPASSQKPASIKDFCDILFFVSALPLGLACKFFCARHTRATIGEPDSMAENFFSQVVPGSACEGRFKFEFERIGTTLIRMRGIPDHVCLPCRRFEQGLARPFFSRAIAANAQGDVRRG
jgi:hypothetical protein